ncbi:MAG: hypothetical protein ACPL5F_12705 [Moorellaceae bacterium]
MLIERYYLERALLFRVPKIAKINSVAENPYSITVYIGDENGEILPEMLEIAERVAEEIRPVASLVTVAPYTVKIEASSYAINMTAARALGAVYSPAHVVNENILDMVAHLQSGPRRRVSAVSVDQLDEVIKGLHLVRPGHVPLEEYFEVIDSSEAERVRRIVFDIIYRAQGDPQRAREEIERLNSEVLKWRKSRLARAEEPMVEIKIDLVGLLLEKALAPVGVFGEPVLSIFGMAVNALFGNRIKEACESTFFADLEDRAFSVLGGVSPAAVRLSKIRRKIGSEY